MSATSLRSALVLIALVLTGDAAQGFAEIVGGRPRVAACAGTDFTAYSLLEGYYTMDSEWPDSSGNGNNLSEDPTVNITTSVFEEGTGAADFAGGDLYISDSSLATGWPMKNGASVTGAFTIAVRVYVDSGDIGSWARIVTSGDDYQTDGPSLAKTDADRFACADRFNDAVWTTTVSSATWYHVACRWDPADNNAEIQLVVDGVERATANDTDNEHGVCDSGEAECFRMGANFFSAPEWDGNMDEALVFSAVLSDTELSDLDTYGADGCGLP